MKCKTKILEFRIYIGSVWLQLQLHMKQIEELESNRSVGYEYNCNFVCTTACKIFLKILITSYNKF